MLRNVDLTIKNHLNLWILELRCGRASFEVPYFEVPYLELVFKNVDFTSKNNSNLSIWDRVLLIIDRGLLIIDMVLLIIDY